MQKQERENENSGQQEEMRSIGTNENGTTSARAARRLNRMLAVQNAYPIAVSKEQYETVRTAHTDSLNLLDSNLRQMAKSVCDIVQTKTGVVRSMYQISRDEF